MSRTDADSGRDSIILAPNGDGHSDALLVDGCTISTTRNVLPHPEHILDFFYCAREIFNGVLLLFPDLAIAVGNLPDLFMAVI